MFMAPIAFLISYMYLMFIKVTKREEYDELFSLTSNKWLDHMMFFGLCIFSSLLMIVNVIYHFPFETACLLIVIATNYAFKSKGLIKNKVKDKVKSFLKNMLKD